MHRCLQIPEILSLIFNETYVEDVDKLGDTSSLSAVCKLFHEVGSPVLWSTLWSLRPLIKCMPDDVWQEEDDEGDSDVDYRYRIRTFILVITLYR